MTGLGQHEWMVLRSAAAGGMAKSAGAYLDHGQPAPGHVVTALDRLIWSGLLMVANGDPIWAIRPISLTAAGQAQYTVRCQQEQQRQAGGLEQRGELVVPPPKFGTAKHASQSQLGREYGDG